MMPMAKRNAAANQQQGAAAAAPPAAAPAADPATQGLQEAEAPQRVVLRQSMGLLLRQLRAYNGTVASLRGQETSFWLTALLSTCSFAQYLINLVCLCMVSPVHVNPLARAPGG